MKMMTKGKNMSEIVQYKNSLNSLTMRTWTAAEMNFFFTILAKVKNHGEDIVRINTNEVKAITKFANRHTDNWANVILNAAEKCAKLTLLDTDPDDPDTLVVLNLFRKFKVNLRECTVEVQLDADNAYILNKLNADFTQFELEEYVMLKSTYSKQLYRVLKQWRTVGSLSLSAEKFRKLLSIPDGYLSGNIDQKVLKPCLKELSAIFKNLKIQKIHGRGRGKPIVEYKFTWIPEPRHNAIEGQFKSKRTGNYAKGRPKVEQRTDWVAKEKEWRAEGGNKNAMNISDEELREMLKGTLN